MMFYFLNRNIKVKVLLIVLLFCFNSIAQNDIIKQHSIVLEYSIQDSASFYTHLADFVKYKDSISKNGDEKIISKLSESLVYLNEDKTDSSLSLCYDLMYGDYELSAKDSIMLYNQIAFIYLNLGENLFSKDYFKKSYSISKRNNLDIEYTSKQLANVFYFNNELDSAIFYTKESLSSPNINELDAFTNLGLFYKEKGDYKNAIKYYNKAKYLVKNNNPNDMRFINYGIGEVYYQKKNYDSSLYYLKKVVNDTSEMLNWYPYINANVRVSEIYTEKELYDSSSYYMEHFFLCPCLDDQTKIWLNEVKADYYLQINDLDNYQKYFNIADKYKDTVIDSYNEKINTLSKANISKMKIIEENLKIKNENATVIQQKNSAYFGLVLILILLVILITIFYLFRSRKKKQIYEIEQQLNKAKINEMKAVEEKLKMEVKSKNTDLSQLATNMVLKRDFLLDQKEKLNELMKLNGEEIKRNLKLYLNDFNSYESIDNNLSTLQGNIQEVNNQLYSKLKNKFPNLTDNDIQIIILHLLKLNTKEIAVLRNVTPKAIQVSRYRIKKKMGLEKDDDIVDFIERELL